jgi:hypothetical protein
MIAVVGVCELDVCGIGGGGGGGGEKRICRGVLVGRKLWARNIVTIHSYQLKLL